MPALGLITMRTIKKSRGDDYMDVLIIAVILWVFLGIAFIVWGMS